MRAKTPGVAIAAAFAVLIAAEAFAMDFRRKPIGTRNGGHTVVIEMTGVVSPGDYEKFSRFFNTLPENDDVAAYVLSSSGGSLIEAGLFAKYFAATAATTAVAEDDVCASACFIMFAAGAEKMAHQQSYIGVHSVQIDGEETFGAMAATTIMARMAGSYGVPPAIIGKMVSTPPGKMAWLDYDDMKMMRVDVVAPLPPTPIGPPTAGAGAPPPAARHAPPSAFSAGLADRTQYERWVSGLSGAFRAGVDYWAANRSRKGAECVNAGDAAWNAGCSAGRNFLTPTDVRRRSDPEYRAGWNAY